MQSSIEGPVSEYPHSSMTLRMRVQRDSTDTKSIVVQSSVVPFVVFFSKLSSLTENFDPMELQGNTNIINGLLNCIDDDES
jgi:hypothetical protein